MQEKWTRQSTEIKHFHLPCMRMGWKRIYYIWCFNSSIWMASEENAHQIARFFLCCTNSVEVFLGNREAPTKCAQCINQHGLSPGRDFGLNCCLQFDLQKQWSVSRDASSPPPEWANFWALALNACVWSVSFKLAVQSVCNKSTAALNRARSNNAVEIAMRMYALGSRTIGHTTRTTGSVIVWRAPSERNFRCLNVAKSRLCSQSHQHYIVDNGNCIKQSQFLGEIVRRRRRCRPLGTHSAFDMAAFIAIMTRYHYYTDACNSEAASSSLYPLRGCGFHGPTTKTPNNFFVLRIVCRSSFGCECVRLQLKLGRVADDKVLKLGCFHLCDCVCEGAQRSPTAA